ncbi:hypothetical protein [Paraburkholderia sp. C35]|uniref:hypothetical protein n=1 Tax=Paraburkholderia sp. C35 TaxID=2126993 RepID=UPI000D696800|nr:hypothetical protein [Paraburkholderia sp. C35]
MSGKKILIIHSFGGVGKSTIAGCLIHPRTGGELLSVESSNLDASAYDLRVHRYNAAEYTEFYTDFRRYSALGNVIADIGASNVEKFIDHLIKSGGHEQFDYVVVPATQKVRGETETITTLQTLLDVVGIAPARIRVVFNKVDKARTNAPIEQYFPRLFAFAGQDGRIQLNPNCWIPELEVFSVLASATRSWSSVRSDHTDYDAKINEATIAQETRAIEQAANNALMQTMVRQASRYVDPAWDALNIDIAEPATEKLVEDLRRNHQVDCS